MPLPEETIKGRNETPDEKAWREFHLRSKQEQMNRIEDAAKFLIGLISVIATILGLQKLDKASTEVYPIGALISGLSLWTISIVLAFLVVFPFKHRFRKGVSVDLEPKYQRICQQKMNTLIASASFFVLALFFSLSVTFYTAMQRTSTTEAAKTKVDTLVISTSKYKYLILVADSTSNEPQVISSPK